MAFVLGVFALIAVLSGSTRGWGRFVWPAIWLFVAWRFVVLGVYVNDWGVRIKNPVVTWWYPWRKIDRFELSSTGEIFAPKANGVALVTSSGRRRLAWALTTSRLLPNSLSSERQDEILAELNGRVPSKTG